MTTRRTFLAQAGVAVAAATWPGLIRASEPPAVSDLERRPPIPTCGELAETGPLQRRWLSIPHSRIVLNPYEFRSTLSPVQQNNGPDLPLSIGYYAADRTFTLDRLLTVHQRPPGEPMPGEPAVAWGDEFDALGPDWHVDTSLRTQIVDGTLELTVRADGATPWGAVSHWVEVDLDTHPELRITVPRADGRWALKVNDGTMPVDLRVKVEDARTGTIGIDLPEVTGWTGTKRFLVRIFAVDPELPVVVDGIWMVAPPTWLRSAQSYSTTWLPHELTATGTYANGMQVRVSDHFLDTDTIIRSLTVDDVPDDGEMLSLTGMYAGQLSWHARQRVLAVEAEHYAFAVALPGSGSPTFFASGQDLVAGGPTVDTPGPFGAWEIVVDPQRLQNSTAWVSVGFATTDEGGAHVAVSRAVIGAKRARSARVRQEVFWNGVRQNAPHPLDFSLRNVPDHGVTPEQVRRNYYTALVFCAANVLPPQPEVGFGYPQLAAGKPSRWTEGAEGARATAMWDSIIGIQLLGYVDPGTAWDAFAGFMSLTQADGAIGGESLPTRVAQTALILYHLTGDRDRLRETYPNMKRFVVWARAHPRWITSNGGGSPPDTKDSQFVFSAILDIDCLKQISDILGMADETTFWQRQKEEFFAQYLTWFWETPTSPPALGYFSDAGTRLPGNPIWVAGGMHLDLWPAGSPQLAGLQQRFLGSYRADDGFAGFGQARYPDIDYTTYGLLDHGLREQADVLVNASLRDVVRANMFAEWYLRTDPPTGTGVRPSLFGMAVVPFAVLLNNGYRFDAGWPAVVRMTDDGGGVVGIPIRGKQLDVTLTAGSAQVRLGGSLIRGGAECRQIDVPLGQTTAIPTRCAIG